MVIFRNNISYIYINIMSSFSCETKKSAIYRRLLSDEQEEAEDILRRSPEEAEDILRRSPEGWGNRAADLWHVSPQQEQKEQKEQKEQSPQQEEQEQKEQKEQKDLLKPAGELTEKEERRTIELYTDAINTLSQTYETEPVPDDYAAFKKFPTTLKFKILLTIDNDIVIDQYITNFSDHIYDFMYLITRLIDKKDKYSYEDMRGDLKKAEVELTKKERRTIELYTKTINTLSPTYKTDPSEMDFSTFNESPTTVKFKILLTIDNDIVIRKYFFKLSAYIKGFKQKYIAYKKAFVDIANMYNFNAVINAIKINPKRYLDRTLTNNIIDKDVIESQLDEGYKTGWGTFRLSLGFVRILLEVFKKGPLGIEVFNKGSLGSFGWSQRYWQNINKYITHHLSIVPDSTSEMPDKVYTDKECNNGIEEEHVIAGVSYGIHSSIYIYNEVIKKITARPKIINQQNVEEEDRRKQLGFNEKNPWSPEKEDKLKEEEKKRISLKKIYEKNKNQTLNLIISPDDKLLKSIICSNMETKEMNKENDSYCPACKEKNKECACGELDSINTFNEKWLDNMNEDDDEAEAERNTRKKDLKSKLDVMLYAAIKARPRNLLEKAKQAFSRNNNA